MYRSITCYIRGLSKRDYELLREMCRYANNLYNYAMYETRQHYFAARELLRSESNYHRCKENENYKLLQSSVGQHILMRVDYAFRSFIALLKLCDEGKYPPEKVKLPHYRERGGLASLTLYIGKGGGLNL